MKAYTDIEQSKKLSEILPLESADMCYLPIMDIDSMSNTGFLDTPECYPFDEYPKNSSIKPLPCWSLAALLATLPNEIITDNRFECHYQIDIRKYDGGDNTTLYQIAYGNNRGSSGSWHDMINTGEKESLIDCCVQMMLKLHELNLL